VHSIFKAYIFYFLYAGSLLSAEWISNINSKKIYGHQSYNINQFTSEKAHINEIHNYFDQYFYKIDPNITDEYLKNPLNLSDDFMEKYLNKVYQLRKDSFVNPIKNKNVDAIIYGLGIGAMTVRIMALYKSIQLGWRFGKVHIITRSQSESHEYQKIIDKVFRNKSLIPKINYVFTHQKAQGYERGCEFLKKRKQIAPYYVVIESSDLFASKMEGRSRHIFDLESICLGSNIFPIKDWRIEAKIHNHDKAIKNENILHHWFYSHMQFLARKIHYEFIHGLDLDEEETLAVEQLRVQREKIAQKPLFENLALIQYERSLCETQEETHFLTPLMRSLGLAHYIKNLVQNYNLDYLTERIFFSLNQKSNMPAAWPELFSQTENNRQQLRSLREGLSKKILNSDANIRDILNNINTQRNALFHQIIKHTEKILGPAPSSFCVLAYGSSGRNEATLYSDFEFGLLFEEDTPSNRRYFQILSGMILLNIINLSETILFQLNFPFFKAKNSSNAKEQWFLDTAIPRGMSIDIIEDPHATKLPIATGKGVPFMGTPKNMANQLITLAKEEYFGYSNLSERLIYGNQKLFSQYKIYKNIILATTLHKSAISTFHDIITRYHKTVFRSWDKKIDFKNTFYRPLVIAIESLSDIYRIQQTSTLERIEELSKQKIISKIEAAKLQSYFLEMQKLRIKMQLKRKGQYEGITENDYPEIKNLFALKLESLGILKKIDNKSNFRKINGAHRQAVFTHG
jgi:hypothetical protein